MRRVGSFWTGAALLIALNGCGLQPGAAPAQGGEVQRGSGSPGNGFTTQAAATAAPGSIGDPASAPPATERASAETVRDRYNALFPASCRVDSVRFSERGAVLRGKAESNAAVAEALRAIDNAQRRPSRSPGADLLLIERQPDGRYAFEMVLNDPAAYAR
ncbi:hypothetical protein [Lysobacter sp. CA199]|uniref:hypothetical protein n=1 Tax=Lysobacter sp. CA199 TaxID=3455608 RepID=UPI003F8D2C11